MRVSTTLLVALAALFGAAGVADAAAPWGAPVAISRAHTFLYTPALSFGADGSGLAFWNAQDGIGPTATYGSMVAARRRGGAFGRERRLPLGTVAVYGSSRAVELRETASNMALGTRLGVAFGRTDGVFAHAHPVASYDASPGNHPTLAANDRGDVAVTWGARPAHGRTRVLVSIRRHGSNRFGSPILLARPPRGGAARVRGTSVGVGPRGDVLVAWEQGGEIHQRYRSAGTSRFAAEQHVKAAESYNARPKIVIDRAGRAVMAWASQFLSEGGGSGPYRVQVAVKAPRSTRFHSAIALETAGERSAYDQTGPWLVLDSSGAALVAYTAGTRAVVATSGAGDRFAGREAVSPAGAPAVMAGLAAGPRGAVAAVWLTTIGDDATGAVGASVRPAAGSAFGAPESISAPTESVWAASVAYDPASGHPVAIWSSRPAGVPAGTITGTVIRIAERG